MATTKANDDLAALKEQLLKELRAELAAEEEKKKEAAKTAKTEEEIARDKWLNELVTVELFRDGKDYKDDVFVAVNGRNWFIKRGVPVQIPRMAALVLEFSIRQDVAANEMSDRYTSEYNKVSNFL